MLRHLTLPPLFRGSSSTLRSLNKTHKNLERKKFDWERASARDGGGSLACIRSLRLSDHERACGFELQTSLCVCYLLRRGQPRRGCAVPARSMWPACNSFISRTEPAWRCARSHSRDAVMPVVRALDPKLQDQDCARAACGRRYECLSADPASLGFDELCPCEVFRGAMS